VVTRLIAYFCTHRCDSVKQYIMAFKKTGNSRDDKSNSSPRKSSGGNTDSSKKTFSSSRKPSSTGFKKFEADGDRPKRKSEGSADGEKRTYNKDSKGAGERSSSFSKDRSFNSKSTSGETKSRPYGSKDFGDKADKKTGYKKDGGSTSTRKPYGSKDFSDRPPREGGFKKESDSAGFKRKPYGTKDFSEKPERESSFKKEGDTEGFKRKPYGTKDFSSKSSSGTGFNRRPADAENDKPFRKREDNDIKRKAFSKEGRVERPRSTREGNFSSTEEQPERTIRSRKKTTADPDKGKIRLNRYISNAGICSRRKADELIVAGVVSVNGEVISELGFKVDPMNDEVRYNGSALKREKMVYVLLNKPKDYITTTEDPQERRTVMHLVEKASRERIYPVGRLDRNTTGLLLMTNDGDLADKLSHPRNNITKLYQVELNKSLTQGDMNKISYGLELEDGLIKPDVISYVQGGSKREIGIQIHSGKNRIVRRIFEHLGYEVVKLDRAIYANLTKKDLPRGRWRFLEEQEIIQLKHLIK
jgi:23S rRNA pseudouridine2605 synthase